MPQDESVEEATDEQWSKFAAWSDIYLPPDGSGSASDGWLPADVSTAIFIRKTFAGFATVAPAVYGFCLLCKEPRLMLMLMSAAHHLTTLQHISDSYTLVVKATRLYFSSAGIWGRPAEKSNMHVRGAGSLTMLQNFGILKKVGGSESDQNKQRLKVGRQWYEYLPFEGKAQDAMKALAKTVSGLRGMKAPRTLKDWGSLYDKLCAVIDFPGAGKYNRPWFFRIFAIAEMRAHKIKCLDARQPMEIREFDECFPDQGGWILRFGSGMRSIQDVWKKHPYSGPPELYSMWTCFFMSDKLAATSADIRRNAASISAAKRAYEAAWGYGVIPRVAYNLATASEFSEDED